jgi:predicted XRE-type DNA-binding protein
MDLQDLIRERGLKQGWIAERLGILEPRFSLMVRGKISIPADKIRPLAALLRIPARELDQMVQGMPQP